MSNALQANVHLMGLIRQRRSGERLSKLLIIAGVKCPRGSNDLPPGAFQSEDSVAEETTIIGPSQRINTIDQQET
ncbi:MAG: hypothetical protein EOO27_34560, partial [Comamonadaceae bacterium]